MIRDNGVGFDVNAPELRDGTHVGLKNVRERIEQMVNYLEDNQFQVLYAAPPEKISSIGDLINTTVSLVPTGRYTKLVEGLVR